MQIVSTAFVKNEPIPAEHSRAGGNVSPPLTFSEVPPEAQSLALILEDPDAPSGTFTHWIVYDMSPAVLQILPGHVPDDARQGTNDFGLRTYDGPAPPSGTHRYVFNLYALDTKLNLDPSAKRQEFDEAIKSHILTQARLTGTFAQ